MKIKYCTGPLRKLNLDDCFLTYNHETSESLIRYGYLVCESRGEERSSEERRGEERE